MGYKVKTTLPKVSKKRKNISITDVKVNELHFVDDTGDITKDILKEIPDDVETINFKISIDIDEE
jgi:hypothetical protein